MNKDPRNEVIKIEKAGQKDWEHILQLLSETGLKNYFSGSESYNTFFVVRDNNKLICCFSLDIENKIAILKSFAIKQDLQGKGVGKLITNQIPQLAKKTGIKRIYASSWESPGFWRKTPFKEINSKDSKDQYFLNYVLFLEKAFPQYSLDRKHFLLQVY